MINTVEREPLPMVVERFGVAAIILAFFILAPQPFNGWLIYLGVPFTAGLFVAFVVGGATAPTIRTPRAAIGHAILGLLVVTIYTFVVTEAAAHAIRLPRANPVFDFSGFILIAYLFELPIVCLGAWVGICARYGKILKTTP